MCSAKDHKNDSDCGGSVLSGSTKSIPTGLLRSGEAYTCRGGQSERFGVSKRGFGAAWRSELMGAGEISRIAKHSGGVLRDLLALTRSAAEYAYRSTRTESDEGMSTQQSNNSGTGISWALARRRSGCLNSLSDNGSFPIDDPSARELLVNRQVLEYFGHGRESSLRCIPPFLRFCVGQEGNDELHFNNAFRIGSGDSPWRGRSSDGRPSYR